MDVTDITPQLEQLDVDIDKLEASLRPLLGDIGEASSKLPLLDRAKLCALISYALESLLFSSLRLNGMEAKNHAIFSELTRVKQYFDKIQKLETPAQEREPTLNTEAAVRVVRANLADDKDLKDKLTELIAKERAKAAAKATKADKKRGVEESVPESRNDQGKEDGSKRPKRSGSKRKK